MSYQSVIVERCHQRLELNLHVVVAVGVELKMNIPDRIQFIVNRIAKQCQRQFGNKVTLIWFGSWVKGSARLQSDIDLAIEYQTDVTQADILAFYEWLEAFPTLYHIDLVELHCADAGLKAEIMRYGKKL